MKQLLILSGKGGTGKTTVACSFIELSQAEAFADCDVDAPNLEIVLKNLGSLNKSDFYGLDKAYIDQSLCISCGLCQSHCAYGAISFKESYEVDNLSCEGCGVCEFVCPVKAIKMVPDVAGELKLFENEKVFSTAQLKMGSGNSGLLVTKVKKQMMASANSTDLAIIDGSPGVGCPVLASISGVDMVLIVTEPSLSGISDLKRIVETTKNFNCQIAVCINKYTDNIDKTKIIEEYCKDNKINFVGQIPFDYRAVKAINSRKTLVAVEGPAKQAVKDIYHRTLDLLFDKEGII